MAVVGPDAAGSRALTSAGLVAVLGAAAFAAPFWVWFRFSEEIASDGGLYGFVRLAVGERVARVHGGIWIVSYALYLGFTVTQIVYDLLPIAFPGVRPYRPVLEIGLPALLSAALIWRERAVLWGLLVSALAQLGLVIALGIVVLDATGVHASAFAPHGNAGSVTRGIANVSLLFLCASLPLYLGGEVAGGARTVRRVLPAAVAVTAAVFVLGLFPLAALASSRLASLELPGYTVAQVYSGHGLAVAVAALAVISVIGLIAAEFLALTRLVRAMLGVPVARSARVLALGWLPIAAVSLLSPERIYGYMLTPSLAALYLSQIFVFAAFPRWARARGTLTPLDVAAAVTGIGLMLFGLEVAISQQPYV